MDVLIEAIRAFPAQERQDALDWALKQAVDRERREALLWEVGTLTTDEIEQMLRAHGLNHAEVQRRGGENTPGASTAASRGGLT